jgi:hypothetical protein
MKPKKLTTEGTELRGILLCNPAFPRQALSFQWFLFLIFHATE